MNFSKSSKSHLGKRKRKETKKQYTIEVKQALCNIYTTMLARKVAKKEILKIFEDSELPVPRQTMERWLKDSKEGSLVNNHKKAGRRQKLDDDQVAIFIGWILQQNLDSVEITRDASAAIIERLFNVKVDHKTVTNYMKRAGIRLVSAKAGPSNANHR